MQIIGIICEYNPFHNGHLLHIEKIKELYPDSLLILVLNGYFLERGEISFLTKEDKTRIALQHSVDLVLELPVLYGTQSADIFAEKAVSILHAFGVQTIVFGSECHNIQTLCSVVDAIQNPNYAIRVKELLQTGINYPTALAKALPVDFDICKPNDLLAISYIKAIRKLKCSIEPIAIERTSDYHDLQSNEKIVSASNIREKVRNKEDITSYLPVDVANKIIVPNEELFFSLLKMKILSTPHLEQFLTVDEGIETRLIEKAKISHSLEEFSRLVKTKRYTYNKINRMFIHILLGITKEKKEEAVLDYVKVLGFNLRGRDYLHQKKEEIAISTTIHKDSICYQYELTAALLYDILQHTNCYSFELRNQPIIKASNL